MSLLLEALKKAEKAKEEAARRTGSASSGELQLADDDRPPPAADDKPVMTRNELPDITRPMEISSEDFATPTRESEASRDPRHSAAQGKDGPEDSAPATRKPAPARPKSTATVNPEERAAAKNVFEAKFKEPNPKLPFYITMALLGAFALGTVVYFWYQLRPPPALVNPNPPKPPGEPVAAAPPQASASDAKPPAAAQESVAPQVPGLASKPVAASTTSTSPSAPAATTGPATTSVLAAARPAAGTPPLAPATVAPPSRRRRDRGCPYASRRPRARRSFQSKRVAPSHAGQSQARSGLEGLQRRQPAGCKSRIRGCPARGACQSRRFAWHGCRRSTQPQAGACGGLVSKAAGRRSQGRACTGGPACIAGADG
jgi:hypothetical protein